MPGSPLPSSISGPLPSMQQTLARYLHSCQTLCLVSYLLRTFERNILLGGLNLFLSWILNAYIKYWSQISQEEKFQRANRSLEKDSQQKAMAAMAGQRWEWVPGTGVELGSSPESWRPGVGGAGIGVGLLKITLEDFIKEFLWAVGDSKLHEPLGSFRSFSSGKFFSLFNI